MQTEIRGLGLKKHKHHEQIQSCACLKCVGDYGPVTTTDYFERCLCKQNKFAEGCILNTPHTLLYIQPVPSWCLTS